MCTQSTTQQGDLCVFFYMSCEYINHFIYLFLFLNVILLEKLCDVIEAFKITFLHHWIMLLIPSIKLHHSVVIPPVMASCPVQSCSGSTFRVLHHTIMTISVFLLFIFTLLYVLLLALLWNDGWRLMYAWYFFLSSAVQVSLWGVETNNV